MSRELLQGLKSVKTNDTTVKIEDGYLDLPGKADGSGTWPSVTQSFIQIDNCQDTFEWDIVYQSDAGNYFYIGFERFDINKATGSNNDCIYIISTQNVAKAKQHVKGTINFNQTISSTNTNKTAFIRLRILNQWSYSSGTGVGAKIYHLSLREIDDNDKTNITKQGQLISNAFWEGFNPVYAKRSRAIGGNEIYEY